ncbi:MAG: hypothetical protein U5K77_03320 [Candidatus Saccharibacteria bacterium]|nr:hypothetical protein [Candidatus Saccharibacteria bacterium]
MDKVISDELWRVAEYIFFAVIIVFAYRIGRNGLNNSNNELKLVELYKRLGIGVLIILGIALFAAFNVGQSTCIEQDFEPRGGCITYADDGYEPQSNEQIATFAFVSLLFGVPYLFGGWAKYNYVSSGKAEEDEKFERIRKKLEDEKFYRELGKERKGK